MIIVLILLIAANFQSTSVLLSSQDNTPASKTVALTADNNPFGDKTIEDISNPAEPGSTSPAPVPSPIGDGTLILCALAVGCKMITALNKRFSTSV